MVFQFVMAEILTYILVVSATINIYIFAHKKIFCFRLTKNVELNTCLLFCLDCYLRAGV